MTTLPLSVIVLAAGKGTRMKSKTAKVLHEVFGAPMVHHVVQAILPLKPQQISLIIGHQKESVAESLTAFKVNFVTQEEQLGTGHAVLVAEGSTSNLADTVMILCGDTPLIRAETLQEMYRYHRQQKATLTLMTTILENPTNYGRIIIDDNGKVRGIVEQKDATPEQLLINEINAGIYCAEKSFLFSSLKEVGTDNSQGEIYLTDIVGLAVEQGCLVEKYTVHSPLDVLGVNSRVELAAADHELQIRRNKILMSEGVSMINPDTIRVSPDSTIDQDTILEPNVTISQNCQISHSCKIGQGSILINCQIGDNVSIGPYSYLVERTIPAGSTLASFSR